MITAAIDTSTLTQSLALANNDQILAVRKTYRRGGHSRILTQEFASMLQAADIAADDIGKLLIGIGPGSFTGLRIGMAFMKGLSRSLSIPLVGRESFAGFAGGLPPGHRVACAVDARKKEVYGGIWTTGPNARRITPETTWKPEDFASHCRTQTANVPLYLAGNGFERYHEAFGPLLASHGKIPFPQLSPSAAGLIQWRPPYRMSKSLEPLYIRPSEAELNG